MKAPLVIRLPDPQAEQVRAEHHRAITELQKSPLAGARIISNVLLPDSSTTLVPHGFGRIPQFVGISVPWNAASSSGSVVEDRSSAVDRTRFIALKTMGWGADIRVDLMVL